MHVLAVNNRGSSGYGKTFYAADDRKHGLEDLRDCVESKKFLATLPWVDTDRIGYYGGSYGGYMVMAALAFTPEEFKVGVNLFGVTNWIRTLKSIPPWWESNRKALYTELGDPYSGDSVALYAKSPLFHADKITMTSSTGPLVHPSCAPVPPVEIGTPPVRVDPPLEAGPPELEVDQATDETVDDEHWHPVMRKDGKPTFYEPSIAREQSDDAPSRFKGAKIRGPP